MRRVLWIAPIVFGLATMVAAQTPVPARGFLVIDGGYQLTKNDFSDTATFRANAEDGHFTTTYSVKSGPLFDVAGGAMLWRRLGVGVGVSRFSESTPSVLSGSVPHPFFFNQPRSVSGTVPGLNRQELAVDIQARIVAPVGSRLQLMVFGGPTFFQVKQGLVDSFTWTDSYPDDTAAFAAAQSATAKKSKLGFNGGADVAFFFARQIGVGGSVEFSGVTIDLPGAGGTSHAIKAGGLHAGAGLRVRF